MTPSLGIRCSAFQKKKKMFFSFCFVSYICKWYPVISIRSETFPFKPQISREIGLCVLWESIHKSEMYRWLCMFCGNSSSSYHNLFKLSEKKTSRWSRSFVLSKRRLSVKCCNKRTITRAPAMLSRIPISLIQNINNHFYYLHFFSFKFREYEALRWFPADCHDYRHRRITFRSWTGN